MTQLILYDGKKPNFHKAIPRSIQQYAAYPVKELTVRWFACDPSATLF